MARKNDGMPRLKTIWRGMFALEMKVEGLRLASKAWDRSHFHNNIKNTDTCG